MDTEKPEKPSKRQEIILAPTKHSKCPALKTITFFPEKKKRNQQKTEKNHQGSNGWPLEIPAALAQILLIKFPEPSASPSTISVKVAPGKGLFRFDRFEHLGL